MVLQLIAERIALGILLLLAVSVQIFRRSANPSDVAQSGQSATPVALANLCEEMGLNNSANVRYFYRLFGILTGNLGHRSRASSVCPSGSGS
ncbi:hypothetical protein [Mesorhizobium erdmanii]|uniref:hypothetical protein n=1 Tax=Mesorhizobium erdmanii TaxID=1777866 RepID=UPI00040933F2|nr:hypothetical protein [Mesorhizobium erdmanii]